MRKMRRIILTSSLMLLMLMVVSAGWSRPKKIPVRPEITAPADVRCSGTKYILACFAPKTVAAPAKVEKPEWPIEMGEPLELAPVEPASAPAFTDVGETLLQIGPPEPVYKAPPITSTDIAAIVKPKGMPAADEKILADQIAVMNAKLKVDGGYPVGTKLKVPVYKVASSSLSRADMREWNYAVRAGLRWGVHPAFLLAVRNHENPKRSRDGFALGVMHAKWTSIWNQYDQGAWVIKRLIADRQGWNPWSPTSSHATRCGKSYAAGSCSWGPAVWSLFCRAVGVR